ncbi:MAG: hypothetical protein WDM70_03075 [Nitrosomonadales bacterium]
MENTSVLAGMGVLCLNVSAGIGIIGMASPLLQEVFAGKLIGIDVAFNDLNPAQKGQIAAIAAGFTACCRCSTSVVASSGLLYPTSSDAR